MRMRCSYSYGRRLGPSILGCIAIGLMSSAVAAEVTPADHATSESRELLRLYQIGKTELDRFADGQPLWEDRKLVDDADGQLGVLGRLLFRAPSFPLHKVERWAQSGPEFAQMVAEPNRYRGAFFDFRGTVSAVTPIVLPASMSARLGFRECYAVSITQRGQIATVFARKLPAVSNGSRFGKQLTADQLLDSPVRAAAMFIKVFPVNGTGAEILAVANSLAWRPSEPSPQLGISRDHVALASYGMDIGQFAMVEDRKGLTTSDRECFYQLMAAVDRMSPADAALPVAQPVDVTELLQRPTEYRGQHCQLVGTARRAIRIQVEDKDIVERFGMDHYFEVEVFTNPAMTVRFVDDRGEGEDKLFHRYPVVVCLPDLPDWIPRGDTIHAAVELRGFFLKHWTYRSEFMSAGNDSVDRRQLSPLLIGSEISPYTYHDGSDAIWAPVFGALFVSLLVGIAGYVWYQEKQDAAFRRRRRDKKSDATDGDSVV